MRLASVNFRLEQQQEEYNCHVLIKVQKISCFLYSISEEYIIFFWNWTFDNYFEYILRFLRVVISYKASDARLAWRSIENKSCQLTSSGLVHANTMLLTSLQYPIMLCIPNHLVKLFVTHQRELDTLSVQLFL